MKNIVPYLIIFALLSLLLRQWNKKESVKTETLVETVIVRDTIRDTLLIPQMVYISRVDTVILPSAADTVWREITVPVERKEYRTDDYHAVIEGFRPDLVSMTVFPETRYVTRTTTTTVKKNPQFGVGIQAGYGYAGKKTHPYIGIGVQYNILSF